MRVLDAYNSATVVIALKSDGQTCNIKGKSDNINGETENVPKGSMTCSPGGYEVKSNAYFDNGFNLRWCPNKIYSDFPFDMTAQSNMFDFLDITDDMWYHDISYEADPGLQKYGCYVTNILSSRVLYIRPRQLEGMMSFSENRHELYIVI
jgi:hypothetical protein